MKKYLILILFLSISIVKMSAQQVVKDSVSVDGVRMVTYIPENVCSKLIEIEVKNDTILKVKYTRGCDGNLKAIGLLVKGMHIDEVIKRLQGTPCGNKTTSCSDQLTKALVYIKENEVK